MSYILILLYNTLSELWGLITLKKWMNERIDKSSSQLPVWSSWICLLMFFGKACSEFDQVVIFYLVSKPSTAFVFILYHPLVFTGRQRTNAYEFLNIFYGNEWD